MRDGDGDDDDGDDDLADEDVASIKIGRALELAWDPRRFTVGAPLAVAATSSTPG